MSRQAALGERSTLRRQAGTTLVELVVVLTLLAVLSSVGATVVTRIVAGQQDQQARLALALTTDAAALRVADELQQALPNSLRLTANADGTWIEWVPVLDAGRYRQAPDTVSAAPGDSLDVDDPADTGFDVIGTPLATLAAGSELVLHNLGTPEADVYAGLNRRSGLVRSSDGLHLDFSASGALPAAGPQARFFIVGTPRTLACLPRADGRWDLVRFQGYGWSAGQPDAEAALSAGTRSVLLAGLGSCSAAYGSALANIGLLTLRLRGSDADARARLDLLLQLPVDNTP